MTFDITFLRWLPLNLRQTHLNTKVVKIRGVIAMLLNIVIVSSNKVEQ
jgi:hypothetical protein